MTHTEFTTEIKRLTDTYTEKPYPEERVKLMWDEFKGLEGKVFSSIVKRLISDCAHAPMADKIRDMVSWAKETQAALDKKLMEHIAREFNSGRMESDDLTPDEVRMFIAGIQDILETKDTALRLKKSEEHQRFIGSVYAAKREAAQKNK